MSIENRVVKIGATPVGSYIIGCYLFQNKCDLAEVKLKNIVFSTNLKITTTSLCLYRGL